MAKRIMTAGAAIWLAATAGEPSARADEGMWTFEGFPSERVEAEHGFGPDAKWLDRVQAASVRLANGCSGSFVSGRGLVLTNYHCVLACVQQLSTAENNYLDEAFHAEEPGDELRCPGMEINRLTSVTDVTEQIANATEGKSGQAFADAKKGEIARIEKACGGDAPDKRCDVVALYNGGLHHLYAYRRFQDVRLVFAPHYDVGLFGGDPDNFNFPRYALDASFLRVYADGEPVKTRQHFDWNDEGPEPGELLFVSGHPGRTQRLDTVAQLEYARDVQLPERLMQLAEELGMLGQFARESDENDRISRTRRLRLKNGLKAYRGRHAALVDDVFFANLVKAEREFRATLKADDALWAEYGGAWDAIEEAVDAARTMRFEVRYREDHRGLGSQLFDHAVKLVRWTEEQAKPNDERLAGYTESKLPALKASLEAPRPVHPELEIARLGLTLTQMRRDLGPDDAFVKAVLGRKSPFERAEELVRGSELGDPAVRMRLFEEGTQGSEDAMIELARVMDPFGRTTKERFEREVESVIERNSGRIADARFALYGTDRYPDATFSLRLSYGTVRGFPDRGEEVEPFTRVEGLYARATGRKPFRLPDVWGEAKDDLNLEQRMNFVSTHDIIGGNSGSPIFDRRQKIVGVVFDGNIYSLGGAYGFDIRNNRAVSVHAGFIMEALDKVYGARRLVKEIRR